MKKWISLGLLAALALPAFAQKKEEERVENAGKVMQEILNAPDSIPQSVLDKADCVVVLPSVLKAAFIFGGSYGRGVMTCRGGKEFHGKWGAPTMMALEGGSAGLQIGGEATDFVLLLMNSRAATGILSSKVKLGGDAPVLSAVLPLPKPTPPCAPTSCPTPGLAVPSPVFPLQAPHFAQTTMPTKISTAKKSRRKKSSSTALSKCRQALRLSFPRWIRLPRSTNRSISP
jgi:hypothetical protein